MNTFSIQNNKHKIEVEGSHGLYKMTMNFHFEDARVFADAMQHEYYVVNLHNDYSDNSSEIFFRKRDGDERSVLDVIQGIAEDTCLC